MMEYPMLTPLYISLLALPPTVACTSGRIVSPKANAMMPADRAPARAQCQAAAVASVPETPQKPTQCIQGEGESLEAAAREGLASRLASHDLFWRRLVRVHMHADAGGAMYCNVSATKQEVLTERKHDVEDFIVLVAGHSIRDC